MAPRKKQQPITLGIMGTGSPGKKAHLSTLIGDYVDANGGAAHLVLPITKDLFTEGVKMAADYAIASEIPFTAVHDEAAAKSKALKPYLEAAAKVEQFARVTNKVVNLLASAPGEAKLLIFWDDDDTEHKTLTYAESKGVGSLDLCDGLQELEFGDESGGDDEDDEDVDGVDLVGEDPDEDDDDTEDDEDDDLDDDDEDEPEEDDDDGDEDDDSNEEPDFSPEGPSMSEQLASQGERKAAALENIARQLEELVSLIRPMPGQIGGVKDVKPPRAVAETQKAAPAKKAAKKVAAPAKRTIKRRP